MLTIKEIKSKKIPYEMLDDETKDYLYDTFKRYVVRKQIADANKELTSVFTHRFGVNPKQFSISFSEFNSAFVNTSLIRELSYDEVHTDYLKGLSEEQFNYHLERTGNSFERKIALMCFSMRPSERIANRIEFPVMVAYANMQTRVLKRAKYFPHKPLNEIFDQVAKEIRAEYLEQHGVPINKSKISETKVDYKSMGKKFAPVWKEMLESYQNAIEGVNLLDAIEYVRAAFIFTEQQSKGYNAQFSSLVHEASTELAQDKIWAEQQMEENPDTYIPADYDEIFSKAHENEVYRNVLLGPLKNVFSVYLEDPIFSQQTEKKKGE